MSYSSEAFSNAIELAFKEMLKLGRTLDAGTVVLDSGIVFSYKIRKLKK